MIARGAKGKKLWMIEIENPGRCCLEMKNVPAMRSALSCVYDEFYHKRVAFPGVAKPKSFASAKIALPGASLFSERTRHI